MAIDKGHQVIFESETENKNNELNDKFDINIKEKTGNKKLEEILGAETITCLKYNELQILSNKNKTKKKEKLEMLKYNSIKRMGLDNIDELSLKIYNNNYTAIKNFMYLMDDKNIRYNEEERKVECIRIIHSIIHDLGFKNNFDNITILKYDELNDKINNILQNNIIYKDFQDVKALFHLVKENPKHRIEDKARIIEYLNLFLKSYSLKIKSYFTEGKQHKKENTIYKLEILNNVQEVIENLKNKGYEIYDTNNIFKPLEENKKIFQHLIIKKIKQHNEIELFDD